MAFWCDRDPESGQRFCRWVWPDLPGKSLYLPDSRAKSCLHWLQDGRGCYWGEVGSFVEIRSKRNDLGKLDYYLWLPLSSLRLQNECQHYWGTTTGYQLEGLSWIGKSTDCKQGEAVLIPLKELHTSFASSCEHT